MERNRKHEMVLLDFLDAIGEAYNQGVGFDDARYELGFLFDAFAPKSALPFLGMAPRHWLQVGRRVLAYSGSSPAETRGDICMSLEFFKLYARAQQGFPLQLRVKELVGSTQARFRDFGFSILDRLWMTGFEVELPFDPSRDKKRFVVEFPEKFLLDMALNGRS